MVSFVAALSIAVFATADVATGADGARNEGVRSALSEGKYPWYDAKADAPKPIWPVDLDLAQWLKKYFSWLDRVRLPEIGSVSIGNLVVLGIVLLAAAVFAVLLLEAWRRYRPMEQGPTKDHAVSSGSTIVEGLPAGIPNDVRDPWAEAVRLRAAGDYAGAIVYLFAHQLMTLDRLKFVRLIPGKTGRQLVRTISDRQFHAWVEPTLRLFEVAYYGHREPSRDEFEAVWKLADAFQRGVAERAVS